MPPAQAAEAGRFAWVKRQKQVATDRRARDRELLRATKLAPGTAAMKLPVVVMVM